MKMVFLGCASLSQVQTLGGLRAQQPRLDPTKYCNQQLILSSSSAQLVTIRPLNNLTGDSSSYDRLRTRYGTLYCLCEVRTELVN